MPLKIDSAILKSLSLDPSTATIRPHGGSGFASTFRLTTPTTSFFIKTAPDTEASSIMFAGEHASLNAIHSAVPSLCPRSFAWGVLEDGKGCFLATEFLDLSGNYQRQSSKSKVGSTTQTLAQKLAKLHTTPAPIPPGYSKPMFGFSVPTCCGDTPQDNAFESSWASFFGKRRLLAILERCEQQNGKDAELRRTVEKTVATIVPRLLGDGHLGGKEGIIPVVVHGDLWSGNHGRGTFVGRRRQDTEDATASVKDEEPVEEEVVFDPSSCYAHHEYEQGIMRMFGGFSSASFMKEYYQLCPPTAPVNELDDRLKLYESYHHLNHYAIFGGGYRSGAMGLLKGLLGKYG